MSTYVSSAPQPNDMMAMKMVQPQISRLSAIGLPSLPVPVLLPP